MLWLWIIITPDEIPLMLYCDYRKRLSQQESLESLQKTFDDFFVSPLTVYNWYTEFNRARDHFEDEFRAAWPRSSLIPENIEAVDQLINVRPHMTYQQIQDTLQTRSAATESILHDYLGLRKMTYRWMPQFLTEAEKQDRTGCYLIMLKKSDRGRSKRVCDIITGGESCLYYYDLETKCQSEVWLAGNSPLSSNVCRQHSLGKIFFSWWSPVLIQSFLLKTLKELQLSGIPKNALKRFEAIGETSTS